MPQVIHQYIDRRTNRVTTEQLTVDPLIRQIYARAKESAPLLFRAATSRRMTSLLSFINFDAPVVAKKKCPSARLRALGVDPAECLKHPQYLNTARAVFERKIRYWQCRPMSTALEMIVSPADARVVVGSLDGHSTLFLKEKFFSFEQLLGRDKHHWLDAFKGGDFALFRLTPDKYHYNHSPVSGEVKEIYTIDGRYHSCNPGAVVAMVTPFSLNRRVVTVIDTDVPGGSHVGLVAMIEVVAMMIGDIVQCYSKERYDDPQPVQAGLFLERGAPKSLYRPGSSVDVLIFQKERVRFSPDILANMRRRDVSSRFTYNFQTPLVETDVTVRSEIGRKA